MEGRGRHRDAKRRARALGPVLVFALANVLAGCNAPPPAATPGAELLLAAFGDSIAADPGDICPGCTSFVDRYAEALNGATGTSVAVRNLGRPSLRVEALLQDLMASPNVRDAVASADAIIVGIGNRRAFNGADGRTASGDLLAPDYIHPSDKGHERIAEVLVGLGFEPLAR